MDTLSSLLWAMCFALPCLAWPAERLWLFLRLPTRRFPARRFSSRPPAAGYRTAAKPDWVGHQVVRLKALMPSAGCRTVAMVFNRRFAGRGMSVSKSYVASLLRRRGHEVVLARRRIKHGVPRPCPANRTWGLDLTGKQDVAGMVHGVLGIVDHGSRRLLSLCLCPRRNAWTLLGHVFLAMGRYGAPRFVRTDNDGAFRSGVFGWGLRLAGVGQQRTTPGCPWQNGRIERVFGTLKRELDGMSVASGLALASLLDEFSVWYNTVRPHQHLAGATPLEAWQGIDPWRNRVTGMRWLSFWDGRLVGYGLRR